MRVKYHATDGTIYEIHAPEGTEITYRSHVQDDSGRFLDDILVVSWRGKKIGLEGNVVFRAAEQRILGLRLLGAAPSSLSASSAPRK